VSSLSLGAIRAKFSLLQDRGYLRLYPHIRPLVGKNKRSSKTRYKFIRANVFKAMDGEKLIHFYSVKRARLYFDKDGITNRINAVGLKYQTEGCTVKPKDIVFDIGANVGEFSISIGAIANHVFSFEPDPVARGALEENAKHYGTFQVLPWAMGEAPGELPFYVSSDGADSSIVVPDTYTKIITAKIETISRAIAHFGLSKVDFLKLEAEGFEPEILKGAGESIKFIRKIAVDVSPERQGESPAEAVVMLLEKADFKVWREKGIVFATNNRFFSET